MLPGKLRMVAPLRRETDVPALGGGGELKSPLRIAAVMPIDDEVTSRQEGGAATFGAGYDEALHTVVKLASSFRKAAVSSVACKSDCI